MSTIREEVAETLGNLSGRTRNLVVEHFAQAEATKQANALIGGLEKLNQMEREFRKINKPDVETFNADGSRFRCKYRTTNGNRCFVGALIPDDQYNPDIESKSAFTIQGIVPALAGLDGILLRDFQKIHDLATLRAFDDKQHMLASIDKLASEAGLEVVK